MLRRVNSILKSKKISKFYSDFFMKSDNSIYIERLYKDWREDEGNVHVSWRKYFEKISKGFESKDSFISPLELKKQNYVLQQLSPDETTLLYSKLYEVIKNFRIYGHYVSDLDPLDIQVGKTNFEEVTDFFSLETSSIPKRFYDLEIKWDFPYLDKELKTSREIHHKMKELYCGKISYEFMHMPYESREWILSQIETDQQEHSKEEKLDLLERLLESEIFSLFIEKKFSTQKRFGVEGLGSAISGLGRLKQRAIKYKYKEIILGMAHRGRLNTLSCVFRKPYRNLFGEFEQIRKVAKIDVFNFSGDVKYHLGTNHKIKYGEGEEMKISVLHNPSHLEIINSVVLGSAKARQMLLDDKDGSKVVPIIIHGDAAIAGQGINYEIQNLENLKNFRVDGAIHLVFNNQIGFTTNQDGGRSSFHCTSIAKLNKNFVIHVNAYEPELVDRAIDLAMSYRNKFKRDVFIDIVGYRKMGHNEQDLPDFCQPVMYKKIRQTKPIYQKYIDKLIGEEIISQKEVDKKIQDYMDFFAEEHKQGKEGNFEIMSGDFYDDFDAIKNLDGITKVDQSKFRDLGERINTLPQNFSFHKKCFEIYQNRLKDCQNGTAIDWMNSESLAFASILDEGFRIRFSGQKARRGPFDYRHADLIDQKNGSNFVPLENSLPKDKKGNLTLVTTPTSELGVLGFEYGYSIATLRDLTIWEVKISELLNNVQMYIDQFISNSEKKWNRKSNLTIKIPYTLTDKNSMNMFTYIDRLLSMVSDDYFYYKENPKERQFVVQHENMRVCNLSKSSNHFHLIRSQVKSNFRKPLFIFLSKEITEEEESRCDEDSFVNGEFETVIADTEVDKTTVKKVVFCSGKFYYDLKKQRSKFGKENEIALHRLEQIGPFPYNEVKDSLEGFSKDTDVFYSQEEPLNLGAFPYLETRFNMILQELEMKEIKYSGKKIASVSGSGFSRINKKEYDDIFHNLFK